jgi:hypothetical protein
MTWGTLRESNAHAIGRRDGGYGAAASGGGNVSSPSFAPARIATSSSSGLGGGRIGPITGGFSSAAPWWVTGFRMIATAGVLAGLYALIQASWNPELGYSWMWYEIGSADRFAVKVARSLMDIDPTSRLLVFVVDCLYVVAKGAIYLVALPAGLVFIFGVSLAIVCYQSFMQGLSQH